MMFPLFNRIIQPLNTFNESIIINDVIFVKNELYTLRSDFKMLQMNFECLEASVMIIIMIAAFYKYWWVFLFGNKVYSMREIIILNNNSYLSIKEYENSIFFVDDMFSKINVNHNAIIPPTYKNINETETITKIISHFHKNVLLKKLESKLSHREKLQIIYENIETPFTFQIKNGGLMKDFE